VVTLLGMTVAPVGLLVIRARIEEGSPRPLRVDVRLTGDTTRGFEQVLRLSEAEAVTEVVHTWLAQFAANEPPQAPPEAVTPPSRRGHGGARY
jgi:hypothetical protein